MKESKSVVIGSSLPPKSSTVITLFYFATIAAYKFTWSGISLYISIRFEFLITFSHYKGNL
jgi:hypothetical protein